MKQMLCQFCNQECTWHGTTDPYDLTDWFDCRFCNVSYMRNIGGRLELVRLYATYRHRTYSLEFDYVTNRTEILLIPEKMDDTIVIVMVLDYLVEGITPVNVASKIETYVTFS